jgi:hypothetical protein
MPPVTVGADHVYVVPAGTISVPFTGVTLKLPPLQWFVFVQQWLV